MLSYKTIYDSLSKRKWKKNESFIIGDNYGKDELYYDLNSHDLFLYERHSGITWYLYNTIFIYFSPYSLYYHLKFKKWIKKNVIVTI